MEEIEKTKILIVDDKPENLLVLEQVLDNPEYSLVRAGSGNEALALMLAHEFAVVVMDVQMPGMSGFEVVEAMQMIPKTRNVPVIFITASMKSQESIMDGYKAGAVDFLPKPFDENILRHKIGFFVGLSRQKKEEVLLDILSNTQASALSGEAMPAKTYEWDPEIIKYYDRLVQKAKEVKENIENDAGVDPAPIIADLVSVVKKELTDGSYEYAMCTQLEEDDLIAHSMRVTFTSLVVGKGLGYDPAMLVKLGVVAFLQDVGMYKIPLEILQKGKDLSVEDMKVIEEHPKVSFSILSAFGEKYAGLAEVALQVHERSNGSGYPNRLQGKDIHEISSVIGIADMYLTLISDGPDRLPQQEAVQSVVEESRDLFPTGVRKAFLGQISLFPVNTYVKLNTKAIGRVVRADKELSLRPTIEVLYNKSGERLDESVIMDLSAPDNSMYCISHGLSIKGLEALSEKTAR
jgi:response regulator RpfG family c-di-GMP phosphodiesterase